MTSELAYSENSLHHLGAKKKFTSLKNEERIIPQKTFLQDSYETKLVQRTFGDISNRVNSNLKSTRKDDQKCLKTNLQALKGMIAQKTFQQNENDSSKLVQRTFGDISNRVNSNLKSTKKINLQSLKATKPKATTPFLSFDGPEFRPEIIEVEDYDDILPPNLKLSETTIKKFVRCWNKKFYGEEVSKQCSSPPQNLNFLDIIPSMEDPTSAATLEPVIDDSDDFIFDVPPTSFFDM